LQTKGSVAGELLHHDPAAGRGEWGKGRHADDFGIMGIGKDQPGVGRKQVYGEFSINGPEEPIGPFQIALPFVISLKIGAAGFAFDDPDLTLGAKRHDVHAQAGGGDEFLDTNEIMAAQVAADAARKALTGGGWQRVRCGQHAEMMNEG
jgi:hypothetical protein